MRWKKVEPGIYARTPAGAPKRQYGVRISRGPRGARKDTIRPFPSLKDARSFKDALQVQGAYVKAGLRPPIARPDRTLRELLNDRLGDMRAAGRAKETVRAYTNLANTICRGLGEHRRVPLSYADMVDFMRWATIEHGTKTEGDLIQRAFIFIRTAHKKAHPEPLTRPECPEVRVRRGHRIRPPVDVAIRFVNALLWGSPERTLAEIMLFTGARLEEVCRLQVEDVDFDAGILRTENRKLRSGPETVEHPLEPELVRVLEAAIPPDAAPTLPVVRMGTDREVESASPFRKRLVAASKRAKIEPPITSLAWIRNFALSRAVDAGIPIEVLSRLAGHASVTTTERHYVSTKMWPQRKLAARTFAALRSGVPDPHTDPNEPTRAHDSGGNESAGGADSATKDAPEPGGSDDDGET